MVTEDKRPLVLCMYVVCETPQMLMVFKINKILKSALWYICSNNVYISFYISPLTHVIAGLSIFKK